MNDLVIVPRGAPGQKTALQIMGPRARIVATGLVPDSAFPDSDFYEGRLPNGLQYEVELMGDDEWDVCLTFTPDTALRWGTPMTGRRRQSVSVRPVPESGPGRRLGRSGAT